MPDLPEAIGQAGMAATPLRPAAVLVPLIDRPEGLGVLFTQRTDHLRRHAGQISFPGGRTEEGDADPIATALRETREEIGLGPDTIRILGRLGRLHTVTGFLITPIVGLLSPPLALMPDPYEVAEIFEVPLALLVDPDAHKAESHTVNGVRRDFIAIYHDNRRIWGATARILVELSRILLGTEPATT